MPNHREAESKKVEAKSKQNPGRAAERRDATMTGGERGETQPEKERRESRHGAKPEPPIIQKTPEGGVN